MSYYTNYDLAAYSNKTSDGKRYDPLTPQTQVDVELEIASMNVFSDGEYDTGWSAYTTWYDWEEDMLLLSKKFPEVLFALHGSGDNYEDLWDAYFLGGKVQVCPGVITYDDFDPLKLIEKDIQQEKYSWQ